MITLLKTHVAFLQTRLEAKKEGGPLKKMKRKLND